MEENNNFEVLEFKKKEITTLLSGMWDHNMYKQRNRKQVNSIIEPSVDVSEPLV